MCVWGGGGGSWLDRLALWLTSNEQYPGQTNHTVADCGAFKITAINQSINSWQIRHPAMIPTTVILITIDLFLVSS